MAHSGQLADRVREELSHERNVQERRMFGRIAFMVNGKMCITAGDDRLMCRIDPEVHDEALKRTGSRTVSMRGREYRGFVYVDEKGLKSRKQFEYWIGLALNFNKRAKASARKRKR
jgi:TfoX/Sxy family transcriptional regulator of competence genes